MLKTRLITAAIFASIVIYVFSFAPLDLYHPLFMVLISLIVFLSGTEFAALRWSTASSQQESPEIKMPTLKLEHFLIGFSYAFLVFLSYDLFHVKSLISYEKSFSILMGWIFSCLFVSIILIYRSAENMLAFSSRLLHFFSGFIYLAVPGICLVQFALMHFDGVHRSAQLYFCLATVFMGDTGAYFVGVRFGKHKLVPRVSPKKSVEGALGGLIFSMVTAFALNLLFQLPFPWWFSILVGTCIGVSGQIGDLIESAFKRAGGFKDSGNLLPGHGGMLDRIDSVILSAPVAYILFSLYL